MGSSEGAAGAMALSWREGKAGPGEGHGAGVLLLPCLLLGAGDRGSRGERPQARPPSAEARFQWAHRAAHGRAAGSACPAPRRPLARVSAAVRRERARNGAPEREATRARVHPRPGRRARAELAAPGRFPLAPRRRAELLVLFLPAGCEGR